MKRRIHRSACAALALISLCLNGAITQCPLKALVVEIPDLEANQIAGLQLWRAEDEASQDSVAAGRVEFGDCFAENGSEMLTYSIVDSQNQPVEVLGPATMFRGEDENGAVTLHFVFGDWTEPPGWIRVTTYNAVGESDPSDEAVFL